MRASACSLSRATVFLFATEGVACTVAPVAVGALPLLPSMKESDLGSSYGDIAALMSQKQPQSKSAPMPLGRASLEDHHGASRFGKAHGVTGVRLQEELATKTRRMQNHNSREIFVRAKVIVHLGIHAGTTW